MGILVSIHKPHSFKREGEHVGKIACIFTASNVFLIEEEGEERSANQHLPQR